MPTLSICINLLLRYENDVVVMALVRAIRAGKVRPAKRVSLFSMN